MCKTPFWKLELRSLPSTPYKHLYLWSDHRIKGVYLKPLRGWMRRQQKYLKCVRGWRLSGQLSLLLSLDELHLPSGGRRLRRVRRARLAGLKIYEVSHSVWLVLRKYDGNARKW